MKIRKILSILVIILMLANILSACVSTAVADDENIIETHEIEKLEIEATSNYDEERNVVIYKVQSNNQLKSTKTSWKLSEDKLTYTSGEMTSNGSYYTTFEDIYGQTAQVLIKIEGIIPALKIETEFIYNAETNTVTGKIYSNNQLKDTKVSWKLSKD